MEIVRLLIIHGADVDIRDKVKDSYRVILHMHLLTKYDHPPPPRHTHTQTKVTAADIAKESSHPDICELLQQHSKQKKSTELSKVRFHFAGI